MDPIKIYEKGQWFEIEILDVKLIPQTKFSDKPQFVWTLEFNDKVIPFWTKTWVSTRSKKFSFFTAATKNFFLKEGDEIDPFPLVGVHLLGLWGEERNKGSTIETFLRFLPVPE